MVVDKADLICDSGSTEVKTLETLTRKFLKSPQSDTKRNHLTWVVPFPKKTPWDLVVHPPPPCPRKSPLPSPSLYLFLSGQELSEFPSVYHASGEREWPEIRPKGMVLCLRISAWNHWFRVSCSLLPTCLVPGTRSSHLALILVYWLKRVPITWGGSPFWILALTRLLCTQARPRYVFFFFTFSDNRIH